MNFLAPERLLLLIPVAALAAGYVVMQRRRRQYAVRFTNLDLLDAVAPKRPGWRRHLAAGLALLSAAALAVGLARPTAQMRVPTEHAIVMLALDTSTSMEATDVSPSRIDAAIAEAIAFVDGLPDEIEVGLVSFNGTAQVLAAPTADHDAVITAIDQLVTGRGTAGGDAIQAALSSIDVALDDRSMIDALMAPEAATTGSATSDTADVTTDATADATTGATTGATADASPAATIVVLSDGQTTKGMDILEAARLAADQQIPVSTITYGTATGTVTVDGQTAEVPPDAETMAQVAALTGGTAFEAADAEELKQVYADLEARVATTVEERELTLAFVAAAFVALALAAGAAFVWTGRFL